jgi:hypothetical protein
MGVTRNTPMSLLPSELVGHAGGWQPIAGAFSEGGGEVRFVPRFPLVPGLSYSLLVDGLNVASVTVPARESIPTADVVAIHPTVQEVPFNLLRVYIWFSAPMSEGCAARSVAIRRTDTGELLDDALLEMEPELWDGSRRRLTVLLDPGRIKRGLVPNLEAGYPLIEGVPVAVSVDSSFRDARGNPLRAPAERQYRVGPAIRSRVNPLSWQLTVPLARSATALTATFDQPLDRALVRRGLDLLDAAARPVRGQASLDVGDRVWRFTPASPWERGDYVLRAGGELEDIAGNSIRRVFDRDLELPEHRPLDLDSVNVPIVVL